MVDSITRFLSRSTLAALMCLSVTPSLEAQGGASIRVLNPALAGALNEALAASTTLQGIVDEIEQSDLIVHVVGLRRHERRRHLGKMQFVTASTTHRFLRVSVDVQLTADRRAGMLAHELFHALEVARARTVVDRQSFAALYRRIGESSSLGLALECFETAEAQRIGRQVQREVRRSEASRRNLRRGVTILSGNLRGASSHCSVAGRRGPLISADLFYRVQAVLSGRRPWPRCTGLQ